MANESNFSSQPVVRTKRALRHQSGILPSQDVRERIRSGDVYAGREIEEDQIQPASLDLRLGDVAYRVRASFLPGAGSTVMDRIRDFAMHQMGLADGAVLERGCVYIVPLMESLSLRSRMSGLANPKSSVGRLDIFTRLITDEAQLFDHVPSGYKGPLYAEIAPRTFSVVVRSGTRLNQLRLQRGNPPATDASLRRLHKSVRLVDAEAGKEDIDRGIAVTVDLSSAARVGYRARRHTDLIDLGKVDHYDPSDFWEPLQAEANGTLTLNPGDFYILASREAVTVPPDHAAEMRAYDTQVGEFRVHYAGFFDPGFGCADCLGTGSRAVLEIRSFEVPFVLRDGQLVGRLVYERLTDVPDKLYGPAIGSSYQRQGLALAKQFKRPS
ncbi:MAG: 2'-deoxycytidine 5'-triphosphate deaminase [Hyphomicrobium sp.]